MTPRQEPRKTFGSACNAIAVGVVQMVERAAVWVVIGAMLLTALSIYYTITHLRVDTDTSKMVDPTLPFRQRQAEFEQAFPQSSDLVVVVIDGATPEQAEDAADALATRLRTQSERFQSVRQPGQTPFFAHNGLLYLDTAELMNLSDQLVAAQPFLATLARDPSLRALFSLFTQALDETLSPALETLLRNSFERIAHTVDALLAGRPDRLSWQEGLLGGLRQGDARRSFVLVQPRLDFQGLQTGMEVLTAIREAVKALHLNERAGVRVRLTGPVAMDEEDLASVSASAKLATALSLGLVYLLLLVGLGALRLVNWILVTLFAGLAWTAAFATATVGYLNLISVTFAVLFIGLGVDFSIQFGMRYREELTRASSHSQALSSTAGGLWKALLLAAGCAAVSFFCFMPTAYRGLAQLGFIAGCSMFIALLATLTVLPALLTLLPVKPGLGWPERSTLPHWTFPIHYPRTVIGITLIMAVGSAALLPLLRFDFNPLNLSDPTTESVQTFQELLADPNTTPYTIEILAPDLEAAQALAARLDKLDTVDRTMTLASFIPSQQEEKLNIIDDMKLLIGPIFSFTAPKPKPSVPEQVMALDDFLTALAKGAERSSSLGASAQRLATALARLKTLPGWPQQVLADLRERVLGELPQILHKLQQLLTAEPVTLGSLPPDLRDDYLTADGRARIEVYPKENMADNRQLRRFVTTVQALAPMATGPLVTLLESGRVVMKACVQATASATLAVLVLLAVVLRSLLQALLIVLPLLLALLFAVALSVLLNLPLNFANIIALPLLLGIGIAFGIYLVTRKLSGLSLEQMFRSSTPRAVLFSGLTTMASFGTLMISRHRGMASMGLLVTLILTLALLATLLVLPAVMAVLDKRQAQERGPSSS